MISMLPEALVPEPETSQALNPELCKPWTLLGGSWVVISGVISPLIWAITIVTLLISPLITTHEPPSKPCKLRSLNHNGRSQP